MHARTHGGMDGWMDGWMDGQVKTQFRKRRGKFMEQHVRLGDSSALPEHAADARHHPSNARVMDFSIGFDNMINRYCHVRILYKA